MNYKENKINFILIGPEIEEVVSAIYHTVLLHRTLPTLNFKTGNVSYNSYLGTRDIDCENFNLTYVCVSSKELIDRVSTPVKAFADSLRAELASNVDVKGSITLDFAVHRKGGWAIGNDPSPWEKWIISIELKKTYTESELSEHRLQLGEQVRNEIFNILDKMNAPNAYVPSMGGSRTEMDSVIDLSMPDICPYKFSIYHTTGATQPNGSTIGTAGLVGNAFRRMLKDALI